MADGGCSEAGDRSLAVPVSPADEPNLQDLLATVAGPCEPGQAVRERLESRLAGVLDPTAPDVVVFPDNVDALLDLQRTRRRTSGRTSRPRMAAVAVAALVAVIALVVGAVDRIQDRGDVTSTTESPTPAPSVSPGVLYDEICRDTGLIEAVTALVALDRPSDTLQLGEALTRGVDALPKLALRWTPRVPTRCVSCS